MINQDTRWGLIGASTIGSQWMVNAIRAQRGHSISSVLSTDASRGAEFATAYGIVSSTTSLLEMLSGNSVDAVYISTINEKHYDQAMAAVSAGKHVMCEKPLAMNRRDAAEMVQAADKVGVVFNTNHHLRNAGSYLAVRELIQSGQLGQLRSIRIFHAVMLPPHLQGWRIDPDIVVHDADTVQVHLEEDPKEVIAMETSGAMGQQGVEDSAMSVRTMPSWIMVQTHESFTHPFATTGFEVHGEKASVIPQNVMTQQPIGDIILRDTDSEHLVEFSNHNLYERSMGMLAAAINGEGVPSTSGIDGVKSLAVAEAVKQAATSGRRITVDYGGVEV